MLLNKLTKMWLVCTPFLASTPAHADVHQQKKEMVVDINLLIEPRCTIHTDGLHFGDILPGNETIMQKTKIHVRCSEETYYSFSMDAGTAYDKKGKQRRMKNLTKIEGAEEITSYISYDLWYLEENRFLTPLLPDLFFSGGYSDRTPFITIYGKAFAKKDEATSQGLHQDVVMVTITY